MSDADDEFHDAMERQRDEEETESSGAADATQTNGSEGEKEYGKFQFGQTTSSGQGESDGQAEMDDLGESSNRPAENDQRVENRQTEPVRETESNDSAETADTASSGTRPGETASGRSEETGSSGTDWQELGRRWHERAYENIEEEGEKELELLVADIVSEQSQLLELLTEWDKRRANRSELEEQITEIGGRLYQLQWTVEWKSRHRK